MSAESDDRGGAPVGELTVPPGTPYTVVQWLVPPVSFILVAAFFLVLELNASPRALHGVGPVLWIGLAVAIACGFLVLVTGYLAYRDLERSSTLRFTRSIALGVGVTGLVATFGTQYIGLLCLALFGSIVARDTGRTRVRLARLVRGSRGLRVLIAGAVGAFLGTVTLQVAVLLANITLISLVYALLVVCPAVVGFVLETNKRAARVSNR